MMPFVYENSNDKIGHNLAKVLKKKTLGSRIQIKSYSNSIPLRNSIKEFKKNILT